MGRPVVMQAIKRSRYRAAGEVLAQASREERHRNPVKSVVKKKARKRVKS